MNMPLISAEQMDVGHTNAWLGHQSKYNFQDIQDSQDVYTNKKNKQNKRAIRGQV